MDMGRSAQGTGIYLRGGTVGETGRGLVYRGLNVWKEAPETGTSGSWMGFVYWDFCEKKKMHIWVPFLGPRGH
jgi:hypothetical protein